jgi:hypothetical protein
MTWPYLLAQAAQAGDTTGFPAALLNTGAMGVIAWLIVNAMLKRSQMDSEAAKIRADEDRVQIKENMAKQFEMTERVVVALDNSTQSSRQQTAAIEQLTHTNQQLCGLLMTKNPVGRDTATIPDA